MPLPRTPRTTATLAPRARALVASMSYEVVPSSGPDRVVDELAPGAPVTVTCSPTRGLDATRRLTDVLRAAGHPTVPHLAARVVESRDHVGRLARWIADSGIDSVFVVGGDAPTPAGPYHDAASLLRELLEHDTGVARIGVAAYPDGHRSIDTPTLDTALLDKQRLLADAGIEGWASTQMCFDPHRIIEWITTQRAAGVHLPLHLGIPGVVERSHLMKLGLRLGIGPSLRYLRSNRTAMGRLLTSRHFDPTRLIDDVVAAAPLQVVGLHCFTFNQVAETRRWQATVSR